MSEVVRTRRVGGILEVTLDRPKANAIDLATSRLLGQTFKSFRDDPELRVAIVKNGAVAAEGTLADLRAGFGHVAVVVVDVTPQIPAPLRIVRPGSARGDRLRIKHDQAIGICPGIVPGMIDETLLDIVDRLPATVQGDMDPACLAIRT